jgi:ectoine hydroxylase-related dioxygenase (phytanoyl-CoA dioxygenase family)
MTTDGRTSRLAKKKHVESFRRRGYVCLQDFLSADLQMRVRQMSDNMSAQAVTILEAAGTAGMPLADRAKRHPTELIVVPEDRLPSQVCRYEFMIGSNAEFRDFVAASIQNIVAELVGESVLPFKDKTNEKLPGGGAFRPHQDFAAYRAFPPRYHATALVTIDTANLANGCVQFASGFEEFSDRAELIAEAVEGKPLFHYQCGGPFNGDIRSDISAALRWEALPTGSADLVVFDSFVPHYSEANQSDKPRRAIFVTFNRESEGAYYDYYYTEKRLNYDDPKFHVSTPTAHSSAACAHRAP